MKIIMATVQEYLKKKQTILNEKLFQWLNQISELFIGTISNWNLENITRPLQPTAKCCG